MPEPFSQVGARRQILEPGVDLELALDDAPWPDTVDQNAITIARRGRVIGAFQIDRHNITPLRSRALSAASCDPADREIEAKWRHRLDLIRSSRCRQLDRPVV